MGFTMLSRGHPLQVNLLFSYSPWDNPTSTVCSMMLDLPNSPSLYLNQDLLEVLMVVVALEVLLMMDGLVLWAMLGSEKGLASVGCPLPSQWQWGW